MWVICFSTGSLGVKMTLLIAIHDYQHGGVGMLVNCTGKESLAKSLGPGWEIISESVENHPFYEFAMERGYEIYELSNPTGLLAKVIFSNAKNT